MTERHKIDNDDASYELAGAICTFIDESKLYDGWSVRPAYPGHTICYNGKSQYIVFTTKVAYINIKSRGASGNSYMVDQEQFWLDCHDPQFFAILGVKLLDLKDDQWINP